MALPKIAVRGREIILLSGFCDGAEDESSNRKLVVDKERLEQVAKLHPDACAFGYIAGEWVAAA